MPRSMARGGSANLQSSFAEPSGERHAPREGPKAREARAFGQWLAGVTGLPVVFWDERFSSVEAEDFLLTAGLTSKRRKARRDRVAAQILLQSYLDAGCPGEQPLKPLDDAGE